jgi:hypothetical protein
MLHPGFLSFKWIFSGAGMIGHDAKGKDTRPCPPAPCEDALAGSQPQAEVAF